jgi:hypothetical protein
MISRTTITEYLIKHVLTNNSRIRGYVETSKIANFITGNYFTSLQFTILLMDVTCKLWKGWPCFSLSSLRLTNSCRSLRYFVVVVFDTWLADNTLALNTIFCLRLYLRYWRDVVSCVVTMSAPNHVRRICVALDLCQMIRRLLGIDAWMNQLTLLRKISANQYLDYSIVTMLRDRPPTTGTCFCP